MGNTNSRQALQWTLPGATSLSNVPELTYWDMVIWRTYDEFTDPIIFNLLYLQRIDIRDWPTSIYLNNNAYLFQDLGLLFYWTSLWVFFWICWGAWDLINYFKYDSEFPLQVLAKKGSE